MWATKLALLSLLLEAAHAQLPKSPSAQIALDGILQKAALDPACIETYNGALNVYKTELATYDAAVAAGTASTTSPPVPPKAICGGTLTVNNEVVTVPKNAMVMLPANALTWQEMFNGGAETGLAVADSSRKPGGYSVSIAANRVNNQIIAATIDIAQAVIISAGGYIDAIDYTTGTLIIEQDGGVGAKVRINDPTGKYGLKNSQRPDAVFDDRFCVDPENPTIRSATGFPMCIPRYADKDDAECPSANRPKRADGSFDPAFTMNTPGNNPNPLKMAPFQVGDYITYAGVLTTTDNLISVYEIINNVAIYTLPGVDPAYSVFEVAIIGTGGLNVLGAGEAAIRSVYEGFTTDATRPVQIWALDFNPADGSFTRRDFGKVLPDPGPLGAVGAVQGRWRFRPQCVVDGATIKVGSAYLGNKGCSPPAGGLYLPPPREVQSEVVGCSPAAVKLDATGVNIGGIDGIPGCTYRNPAIEYIWGENVPGSPIVENNFNSVPFITRGGYSSSMGTTVGMLDPWPSNVLPTDSCAAPTITFDTAFSVISGGSVKLSATVTGPSQPFTYLWKADAQQNGGSTATPTAASPTFGPVTTGSSKGAVYTLRVTNACAVSASKDVTVQVLEPSAAPELASIAAQSVLSGAATVSITATSTANALFKWTVPAGVSIKQQAPSASATTPSLTSTITFTAPNLPVNVVVPLLLSFSVTATAPAAAGAVVGGTGSVALLSASTLALVTVNQRPDTVTITTVQFRCDKHRMTVTATSNIDNPALVLKLLDYTDNQNILYGTSTIGNTFTYGPGGLYTLDMIGVKLPATFPAPAAPFKVVSSLNGSGTFAFTTAQIKNTPCAI